MNLNPAVITTKYTKHTKEVGLVVAAAEAPEVSRVRIGRRSFFVCCVYFVVATAVFPASLAQPVLVTLKLDQNQIVVGGTTTLHVFAAVAPAFQPQTDRIFSWDVDLLNLNGAIAAGDYAALQRPSADKNPQTSSTGLSDGANRLGIFDTFINLPAAGRDSPVELLSIPIKALAAGVATFRVRAGTGVPGLSADFLVAVRNEGEPLAGGQYDAAIIALEVTTAQGGTLCTPTVTIQRSTSSANPGGVTILFPLCPAKNHVLQYSEALGGPWQPVSGAPHNSGAVQDKLSDAIRFYRLSVSD